MADLPAPSVEAERQIPIAQSEPVTGDSLALPVDEVDNAPSGSSSPTLSRSASLVNRSSRSKTRQGSLSGLATCPSLDFMQSELSMLEQNGASQDKSSRNRRMVLEMADGTAYEGIGFGAEGKSISGECVFQTGPLSFAAAEGRQTQCNTFEKAWSATLNRSPTLLMKAKSWS